MSNEVIDVKVENSPKKIQDLKLSKLQQRKIAKAGLVSTLGFLAATGLTDLPFGTKKAHAVAGVAMMGFALWHYCLSSPKKK